MLPQAARGGEVSAAHEGRHAALPGGGAGAATTSTSTSCRSSRRWPEDGGALHHAADGRSPRDPKRGIRNVGMYRVQVLGRNDARDALAAPQGRRGALARDGRARREDAGVHRARRRSGQRCTPARAPLPPDDRRVPLRRLSPARAGAAGEGGHLRPRGAGRSGVRDRGLHRSGRGAGDSKGRSAITPASTRWPTCIRRCTSRRSRCGANPIYPATIVGRPPMEDFYLGHATERIFLPLLRLTMPGDRGLPHAGRGDLPQPRVRVDRQAVSRPGVQGDERAVGAGADVARQGAGGRGQGRERAESARRRGGSRSTTSTPSATCASRWARWTCSITRAARFTYGSKMGIDATRKWPEEGFTASGRSVIEMDAATKRRVDAMWSKLGIRWRTGAAEQS